MEKQDSAAKYEKLVSLFEQLNEKVTQARLSMHRLTQNGPEQASPEEVTSHLSEVEPILFDLTKELMTSHGMWPISNAELIGLKNPKVHDRSKKVESKEV